MSTSLTQPIATAAPDGSTRHGAIRQRGLLTAALALGGLGAALALSSPLWVHLGSALGAVLLGPAALWAPKGGVWHRRAGHLWVGLMIWAALSALFLRDSHLPNLAGFTPIHLLIPFVLVQLILAIRHAANGRIDAHRQTMKGLYFGACVGAGVFTLLPQRLLGHWLWHSVLGWL